MNGERDIDAGEYVLGTLGAEERARFRLQLASDAELRASVRAWEARLAPLADAIASEAPSAQVWRSIERATLRETSGESQSSDSSNVVQLRRRLSVWRGAALAAGAIAACLAAVVVFDLLSLPSADAGGRYVAVVDSGGREPALIAEVDTQAGVIRVRSLTAETPSGQSLELWHVPEGEAPRSLGILAADAEAQTIEYAVARGPVSGIIAVSIEPQGGSPSGAPTGEIVYTGRLIPVE
jgi:anti-sigma-K factor RskA